MNIKNWFKIEAKIENNASSHGEESKTSLRLIAHAEREPKEERNLNKKWEILSRRKYLK